MKKLTSFLVSLLALVTILVISCQAQPKTDYEIYSDVVPTADHYVFFMEKKSANPYQLTEGMDYLAPNVSSLIVGQAQTPTFTINLDNDGSEYKVGIVAVSVAGFYSGMGTTVGTVGIVPVVPGNVGFRKKT